MADIIPFRGLIYNSKKIEDLSLIIAPPYDVISEKAIPKYYARHPHNVIRLELGDESSGQERYRLCANYFNKWRRQEILFQEKSPAFYFYQVEFHLEDGQRKVRRGFIGLCRLEDFGEGMIFPHERIHEEQKDDRLKVLRACQANISPIFSLYSDPDQTIYSLFEPHLTSSPLFDFIDEEEIRHTVWSIKKPSLLREVRKQMNEKRLFIADGHHRYDAALAYKRENQKRRKCLTAKESFNYTMMYFCSFEDDGLVILPSHRLIFSLSHFNRADFEDELQKYFLKKDYPYNNENEQTKRTEFFQALEEEGRRGNVFGLYIQGNYYFTLLKPKKGLDIPSMMGRDIPNTLQKLDVMILHRFILEQILDISEKDQDQTRIRVIKNQNRAIELVKEGKFQMAILLNPPRVEDVQEVAREGEFMPQKSTFFYPKLPTGLVINSIASKEIQDDLIL